MSKPQVDQNDTEGREASVPLEDKGTHGHSQTDTGEPTDDVPDPLRNAYAALRAMLPARPEERDR